jgi:choline dehydrogenase
MQNKYTYIVVGSGSSGCALAGRLAKRADGAVLLVEAGARPRGLWSRLPAGYAKLFRDPRYNWNFVSEPEAALNGRVLHVPRGKALGGSSAINGLVHIRATQYDLARWVEFGCSGWGYDELLPYYIRSESNSRGASATRGIEGPLAVSDYETNEICDRFLASAEKCGIPRIEDFNVRSRNGAAYYQANIRAGRRCSAADAYLSGTERPENLDVLLEARATKVIVSGGRAVGVELLSKGRAERVFADETIICAGAIGSPHLLMLSGIGPADHLRQMGIDVVLDNPNVGAHLQDHYQVKTVFEVSGDDTLNARLGSPFGKLAAGIQWIVNRNGPLSIGGGYVGAFIRSSELADEPDSQIHFMTYAADKTLTRLEPFSAVTMSTCLLRPYSEGEVRLKTADPVGAPAIKFNYLLHEADQKTIVAAMQAAYRIAGTGPLSEIIRREVTNFGDLKDHQARLAYCRDLGGTIFHPSSTCRMGPEGESVVDPELKVHGLDGLRVADASIMPFVISGNTHATCVAIGEKCADLLAGAS